MLLPALQEPGTFGDELTDGTLHGSRNLRRLALRRLDRASRFHQAVEGFGGNTKSLRKGKHKPVRRTFLLSTHIANT